MDDKEAITVTVNDEAPVVEVDHFGEADLAIVDFGDGDDWIHG